VTGETEVDRQGAFNFRTVQRAGIVAGNGGIGADLAALHGQKTVQRLIAGTFAEQCPFDVVALDNMLAKTEEGRIAMTFGAA
jgi:hypothetical protein